MNRSLCRPVSSLSRPDSPRLEAYFKIDGYSTVLEALLLVDRQYAEMPNMNEIEATRRIKKRYRNMIIVGLSMNAGDENQLLMQKAGAEALLTKEAAVQQLYVVIQEVMKPLSPHRSEIRQGFAVRSRNHPKKLRCATHPIGRFMCWGG